MVVGPGAKKYFEIDKSLGTRPPLEGLADEAYTYAESYRVYFRKDSTWVVMSLVRLEDHPYYMKTLVSLAHTVAARLPERLAAALGVTKSPRDHQRAGQHGPAIPSIEESAMNGRVPRRLAGQGWPARYSVEW